MDQDQSKIKTSRGESGTKNGCPSIKDGKVRSKPNIQCQIDK